MSDWPPRFTLTADGAAKLIMLNFAQEQDEAKTVLAITRLVNEAYEKGIAVGQSAQETSVTRTVWTKTPQSDPYCIHCGKTWDMHLCDGFSSCPTANRRTEHD